MATPVQPTCTVRPATLADFNVIYGFVNALEDTVFPKDILYNIFQKNIAAENTIYLVAEQQNEVIGYISCHGQYLLHHAGLVGEIQELFVNPDRRGEGIGKLLMDAVKAMARQKGMIQLEVTANAARLSTHRFYEREHFKLTHKKFVCPLIV